MMSDHGARRWWVLACGLGMVLAPVAAQGAGAGGGRMTARADEPTKEEKAQALGVTSVREHQVTIGGQVVRYRATAAYGPINDDRLKIKARVFHVVYERLEDAEPAAGADGKPGARRTLAEIDPSTRPVTFAFNGGPGSSSVWLHLGTMGPRRVVMGPEGERAAGPALGDNAESWLGVSDLVFIDPVSTGYSRAAEGEDPKQFHGVEEDVRAVGEFIRLYLSRGKRWLSPIYLVGESYGTTRAAALSGELQGRLGVTLRGIVLVSPVLNFQTIAFDTGNDTPYWLFLPSFAATAFHHGRSDPSVGATLEEVADRAGVFARTEYLAALAQGDALGDAERQRVAQQLAKFTGLSEGYIARANLRVGMSGFTKELLREAGGRGVAREVGGSADTGAGRTVGRFDSRYTGIDRNANAASFEYDPSYAAVQGPFTGALNDYVRRELGFSSDLPYEILTGAVQPWNYGSARNRFVDVSETLRAAMTQNPGLRVWVAAGYFDLATPFFAAQYTLTHMGLHPSVRGNTTTTLYKAGHMMYVRDEDRRKLYEDAVKFYGR